MGHEIISESFDLTDAIKDCINSNIEELEGFASGDSSFHVFLSKEGPGLYAAKFRTHAFGKDYFAESSTDDIYSSIAEAKGSLKRQLIEDHRKMIQKHRQKTPHPVSAPADFGDEDS